VLDREYTNLSFGYTHGTPVLKRNNRRAAYGLRIFAIDLLIIHPNKFLGTPDFVQQERVLMVFEIENVLLSTQIMQFSGFISIIFSENNEEIT